MPLAAGAVAIGGTAAAEDRDVTALEENVTVFERNIQPLAESRIEDGETVIVLFSGILFDTGSSELSAAARAEIGRLVADVPTGASISIDGYTDTVPYPRGNDVLSQERAQAVAAVIAEARPDLSAQVALHGEADPVGDNGTPQGRAENRRVEIRYAG